MADNIDVTPGSGKTVAAEEISTVQYQKVKLIDSTVGSTTPVGTLTNPLRIDAQIMPGGGHGQFSNASGDFTATVNVGAKTITFSAFPSTVLSAVLASGHFTISQIKRRNTSGVVDFLDVSKVSYSGGVLTLGNMAANFATGDTVEVIIIGPDKAYDAANNWDKVSEQNKPGAEINTGTYPFLRTRQTCKYSNISADTAVLAAAGFFFGFVCNSTSSGTVIFYDNASAASGTKILNTFTPTAGQVYLFPAVSVTNGIYADISNTLDITVFYAEL